MKQKIIKVGNSIGVTVPSSFVKAVGVKIGGYVQVTSKLETGQVIYTFKGAQQLTLDNSLKKKA